jgi:uncharacterized protein YbgA (DUF1722 family)/uncharacterized protein YbbK (DUF523 family)
MNTLPASDTSADQDPRIPVGISQCLLGDEVRYNGGHKLSRFCRDQLGEWFRYVDICPEVEIGLGVPREPMRMVEREGTIRVLEIKDPTRDHTDKLVDLADSYRHQISQLCGYIFMQNSPSCGAFRGKVYHPNGNILHTDGQGAFAARVQQQMPWLPVEESGRLSDAGLCENFVTRVFVFSEWRALQSKPLTRKAIIDFHARHKYLVMAHSQRYYKVIGKLLSRAGFYSIETLALRYEKLLLTGLKSVAGRKGHTNALQHMQGYVSSSLDAEQRADLTRLIESYKAGEVPLIAPLVLLRHYAGLGGEYFQKQIYLQPHPKSLGLYNKI